ncbi:hypothetical protein ABZ890_46750 [Streptomyces sp. NPDC046984]|uniref:hypothetical protein n=1 Tax=Streptomyces sp. NPDC046984 TaxID=3155138 RepID=UPI0033E7D5E4
MSIQDYVLSAAYARATAVEDSFLQAFKDSMERSGHAFAAEPSAVDPTPAQRTAERHAIRDLEPGKQGHAA